MQTKHNWFLKLIICFQIVSDSHSSMRLYANWNYDGYMGPLDLKTEACIDLPSLLRNKVSSIITDECIMLHSSLNCTGYSYKFLPGRYENLQMVSQSGGPIMNDKAYSIGRCKSTLSTAASHVQFLYGNEIVLDIKNLCERIEIAPDVSRATSIDNHESCIILHRKNSNVALFAGKSIISKDLREFVEPRKPGLVEIALGIRFPFDPILAISPCRQSEECHVISLNASVIHFALAESKAKSFASKTSDLSMAATTTFINDGWATVSQEYQVTKTITEATEITLVESFSKMNNWYVGASLEVETKIGSWIVMSEATIKASLSTAYTREETQANEEINTRRHEVSKEFSASERIEIEPCTRYKVDSYIRVKEKYPMRYTITYEVTGTKGDIPMTAGEIRKSLGNLNYVRNKDLYTVVASEISEMYLDFGVETIINGKGEIIAECRNAHLKTELLAE